MNNQTVNDIQNRRLDQAYFSIICMSIEISIKKEESITRRKLNIFYGCTLQGKRVFLDAVLLDEHSKTSDWYNIFMYLKQRGINVILYAHLPNIKTLKEALILAFKDVIILPSCFDAIDKITKYYSLTYSSNIYNLVKKIYFSTCDNEFNANIQFLLEGLDNNQFIIDLLEPEFKNAKQYQSLELPLKKHIISFYFYRDNRKALKSLANSRLYFENISDFLELMLPIIQRQELRTYCPKKEWNEVINIIYESKKELIKCYF